MVDRVVSGHSGGQHASIDSEDQREFLAMEACDLWRAPMVSGGLHQGDIRGLFTRLIEAHDETMTPARRGLQPRIGHN